MTTKTILFTVMTVAAGDAAANPDPPPGAESGRVDRVDEGDSTARKVGRGILFVPRGLVEIALFPIRLIVDTTDREHLPARAESLFFNDARTFGIYPTLQYDSDSGFVPGAQMDVKITPDDRFRAFGGVSLHADRQHLKTSYDMANRFDGRFALGVDLEYDKRPHENFFGIGNADTAEAPAMPIDLEDGGPAVETHYGQELARASTIADVRVYRDLHVRAAATYAERERSVSSRGPAIDEVYDPMSLVDFDHYGVTFGELDLRWDTRRRVSVFEPSELASQGSLISTYAGAVAITDGAQFVRYGTDLQHYQRIGEGPRVIAARFHGEGITAGTDEVPFTELPSLGGSKFLRGYAYGRFRDRIAAVATLEYQWDLSQHLFASLFTDAGRVYASPDELSLEGMRAGYGFSLEAHSPGGMLARASVASSIDGGVFFDLYFEPVSAITPRVERR